MWYWNKYTVEPSEENIEESYTVTFIDYPDKLFADSETEAHELAIDFLWRMLND
ncbi:hypothetical protein Riv7116_6917 (plasmid) [Rivularia sp. PCC 7116]|uniref:hypothetical protein n=1 Tax=Rivularia sp. PCC 7116 TaxID=373994 RepID=UPI00029F0562|nr:hypothetical protein [Rivularia sp. PCC 7116]AFY59229.1 hypothetical protein Riv7116_6917 [Rivularia sp. PCC 7116]